MNNRRNTQVLSARAPTREARAVLAWASENKLSVSDAMRALAKKAMAAPAIDPEEFRAAYEAALQAGDWDALVELLSQVFPDHAAEFAAANEQRKAGAEPPALSARQAAQRNGGV